MFIISDSDIYIIKKINSMEIIKKEGEVDTCQPNHSIITFPLLLENHIANELINVISPTRKKIFSN